MPQKNNHVLVTGGAGYIGSHVSYALKKAGYMPVCFDNLSTGHEWAIKFGPFFKGDLLKPNDINAALNTYNPVGVIHLASLIQVGESTKKPLLYYQQNVQGSINLVQSMVGHNISHLVFSSSAAVYGETQGKALTESLPMAPKNPYGATKSLIERFLQDVSNSENLHYIALRYFNAAGAHPAEGIGEAHDPETHLIPLLIKAGLKNHTFTLFGDNYPTDDGTCVRDYVHVMDLAEAHVQALQYVQHNKKSTSLNLGSGQGTSIRDVVTTVETMLKKAIKIQTVVPRVGDPAHLVACVDKAQNILGWKPKRNLTQIIQDALAWEQLHHG